MSMRFFGDMADFSGFEVPPQSLGPFLALARLSDEDASTLVQALEMPNALATAPELIERVREHVPGLKPMISGLVFSIIALIGSLGQELDETRELAEAVSDDSGFAELEDGQRAELADRLERLIRSPCPRLTAKAASIRTAYEYVFAEALILTDMRPVFADGQTDTPTAGVIVDTLKLDYYGSDGVRRSFYVALDQEDLVNLRDQAARGLAKSKGMRQFLESAKLKTWKDEWDAAD